MIVLLIVLLVMLVVPALIWAAFRVLAPAHRILRLAGTAALPPMLAVAALAFDAAKSPGDKMVGAPAYFLVFIFPFIMGIGVAGFCEAWAGKRRK